MICLLITNAMLLSAAFSLSAQLASPPSFPMQCTLVVETDDAPSVGPGDPMTTEEIA